MNLTNYDDYDWHDEDYTGQPPDDDQSLIAGLEPDTDPDDNSVTVLEYGSSADSDSFMSDEDMDECPDEYLDDCDDLDAVILPYLTGSKPGKKKRKKKHKKKSKKKSSASSKGVNLLKLAAFAKGDDEDAQLTDDEQKPPTKGRFKQPGLCQMEEELLEKAHFIYRKTVLYYYNGWYYEPIDAEGVVALYRQYISPGLDGVKNLRNHMDMPIVKWVIITISLPRLIYGGRMRPIAMKTVHICAALQHSTSIWSRPEVYATESVSHPQKTRCGDSMVSAFVRNV